MANGSLKLLTFGQPQRTPQRSAASRAVAAVVAEPGVHQACLQAHPFRYPLMRL